MNLRNQFSTLLLVLCLCMPLIAYTQITALDYTNQGNEKNANADFEGAIADFTRAIDLDPKCAVAYHNRGVTRISKGDLDGAITDFTCAVEIDPKYLVAYRNRGATKVNKGDLDGAIADFTRAIEIDPNHARAYSNRGSVRISKGDLIGAIADLNRAIELDPNYVTAYYNRAEAKTAYGDATAGQADVNRAREIENHQRDQQPNPKRDSSSTGRIAQPDQNNSFNNPQFGVVPNKAQGSILQRLDARRASETTNRSQSQHGPSSTLGKESYIEGSKDIIQNTLQSMVGKWVFDVDFVGEYLRKGAELQKLWCGYGWDENEISRREKSVRADATANGPIVIYEFIDVGGGSLRFVLHKRNETETRILSECRKLEPDMFVCKESPASDTGPFMFRISGKYIFIMRKATPSMMAVPTISKTPSEVWIAVMRFKRLNESGN